LAVEGERRFTDSHVPEEGAQCGETSVSRPGAVPAVAFEVFQELAEEIRVELLHADVGGRPSEALRCETEQQAEGVPIAGHSVRARAELSEQPVREKTL
jgi:hypothetical protein